MSRGAATSHSVEQASRAANRRRGHGIAVAGLVDDDAQNHRAGAVLASATRA